MGDLPSEHDFVSHRFVTVDARFISSALCANIRKQRFLRGSSRSLFADCGFAITFADQIIDATRPEAHPCAATQYVNISNFPQPFR